jgi:hypothetical protein
LPRKTPRCRDRSSNVRRMVPSSATTRRAEDLRAGFPDSSELFTVSGALSGPIGLGFKQAWRHPASQAPVRPQGRAGVFRSGAFPMVGCALRGSTSAHPAPTRAPARSPPPAAHELSEEHGHLTCPADDEQRNAACPFSGQWLSQPLSRGGGRPPQWEAVRALGLLGGGCAVAVPGVRCFLWPGDSGSGRRQDGPMQAM